MLRFKDNVDLGTVLKSFVESEDRYLLESTMDEYFVVYKDTRRIDQQGYTGLLLDYMKQGLVEEVI